MKRLSYWAFLKVIISGCRDEDLVGSFLRGVEPIFRRHFLHHAAGSLKLSIRGEVEGSNNILVRIPIIFGEVSRHDELRTARR